MEKVKITLKNKIVVLLVESFDADVNTEDILRIDYSNIIGELLTFPTIFNRIGILRAEMEHAVSVAKLELGVYQAQKREFYRNKLSRTETKSVKGGGEVLSHKKPTIDEVESAVTTDKNNIEREREHLRLIKDFGIIDSLYWSAKSKDSKLNKFAEKITPEEFEQDIIEGTFNTIHIKVRKKLIN